MKTREETEMFGKNVPYENIRFFELDKTFELNNEQFVQLMTRGHLPDLKVMVFDRPWNREVLIRTVPVTYGGNV